MVDLDRRRWLQTASAILSSACAARAFGDDAARAPAFSEQPTFDPQALFLTWQRDPTTTMTIQWIGSREDGADRPIWFAKAGKLDWKRAAGTSRPFPMTNQQVFRTELVGLEPGTDYVFSVGLD